MERNNRQPQGSRTKTWFALVLFIAICQAAGLLGVITTPTANSAWFESLTRPSFDPPGWLFGPVWTVLYTLMGIAAFRVWRIGWTDANVRAALKLFSAQLVVNAAWTPVFFGAHRIGLAAAVIVSLVVLVVWVTRRFFALDRPAGWMLVPYIAWLLFAAALNIGYLILN